MTTPAELSHFHLLATLAEDEASGTYKVLDPEDGAILVARAFVADSPRVAPSRRMLARDARVAMTVLGRGLVPWRRVQHDDGKLLLLRDWVDADSLARHPNVAVGADPRCRGGRATEDDLLAILGSALEALLPIHDRGLAAIRVRPNNLFLTGSGEVLIADWGVRIGAPGGSGTGNEVAGRGSAYAAPETRAGQGADAASDLWALGAILFEIALGRLPSGNDLGGLPCEALGTRLGALLARLVDGDPTRRFASARETLRALERPLPPPLRDGRAPFRAARAIGREAEIADLHAAVDRLVAGQGDLVFVRGEAGVGKTRLAEEVGRWATMRGVAVLRGGPEDPSGHPFGRLVPCFEAIARDKRTWTPEEIEEALQSDGRVMLEITSSFHDLASVRRLPEPPVLGSEASRRRLLRVAARALATYARRTPALLVLDDLESADSLTLDFVRFLARTVIRPEGGRRGAPLLVLACYAEEAEARGPLRAAAVALRAKGLAREVVLKPLAPHEVRDFLVQHLGTEALPGSFVARIMNETGGVPLKIEETLAWLAGHRVLEMPTEVWTRGWEMARRSDEPGARAVDPTDSLALMLGSVARDSVAAAPPAIVGLRLRRLPGDARRLVETVALAGDRAPIGVLRQAAQLLPEAFENALVEGIIQQALVEPAPDVIELRHGRLRDALVAELDPAARRMVHGRIGLAIEQNVGRLDERTPLRLAHHFHQAGDVERALLFLPLAARILKDRHLPGEAMTLFSRFFRHLEGVGPEDREKHLPKRLQALQAMAETLCELGRGGEASSHYREMAAVAESSGRERDLVSAWSGLAALQLELGELDSAQSFGARAIELARKRDLAILVAENLRVLGRVWLARQRHGQAIWDLSAALEIYREQGDHLGIARSYAALGDVHAARYRHRPALLAYRKAYREFRALDDKVGLSCALNRLGRVQLALGDASRAIAYHREAARLEREADDREGVGRTLDLLGDAYRERGDVEFAEEAFKEALAIKRELADVRGSADSLLSLAHVTLQAGRLGEASALLEQALTLARRTSNTRAEAGALVRLAQSRWQRGDSAGALELSEEGLRRAAAIGNRALECRALLVLASAHASPEEAMRSAVRAADAAAAVGLGDLVFRARVRLGDLLRAAGREEDAHREYASALDAASELVGSARSARDGFLRREDVRESLRGAGAFVAGRTDGDLLERYPVLRYADSIQLATEATAVTT